MSNYRDSSYVSFFFDRYAWYHFCKTPRRAYQNIIIFKYVTCHLLVSINLCHLLVTINLYYIIFGSQGKKIYIQIIKLHHQSHSHIPSILRNILFSVINEISRSIYIIRSLRLYRFWYSLLVSSVRTYIITNWNLNESFSSRSDGGLRIKFLISRVL